MSTNRQWIVYSGNPNSKNPPQIYFQAGSTSKDGYTRYEHFVTGNRKNFIDHAVGSTRDEDKIREAIQEYIEFHENKVESAREILDNL